MLSFSSSVRIALLANFSDSKVALSLFNTLTNTELSKYHFNYHLGKKNQNLHKWEAQLDGDYRVDTENIKQACIEFYNAVLKL